MTENFWSPTFRYMKAIVKYWGYLLVLVLVAGWWSASIGPEPMIVLSIAVALYFLFQAPVWCGAKNRDGTLCRRNASGLLLGCSLRQHKWQKLELTVVPHAWRELNRGLWANPTTGLATLGTVAGIVSAMVATITSIVG